MSTMDGVTVSARHLFFPKGKMKGKKKHTWRVKHAHAKGKGSWKSNWRGLPQGKGQRLASPWYARRRAAARPLYEQQEELFQEILTPAAEPLYKQQEALFQKVLAPEKKLVQPLYEQQEQLFQEILG